MAVTRKRTIARKAASYKEQAEQLLRIGETLAMRNCELERRHAAQVLVEQRHRDMMPGLPALSDSASMEARFDRLSQFCGVDMFKSEPGKIGGFSPSERKRILDARRRASLRSSDASKAAR